MADKGTVKSEVQDGIGTVEFYHPKGNSLPGALLLEIADQITILGNDDNARVVVLRSGGEKKGGGPFCAGASFDELAAVDNVEKGVEFFMGFAQVILSMKNCPKFIIARIHGKAVGGGVGIASAADYAIACAGASVKLSELMLGFGPFVIGPALERKLGLAAFSALTIDTAWRDAGWAKEQGLFAAVCESVEELDKEVDALAAKLAKFNPEAMAELKKVFWRGTDHWDTLLPERAAISGRLVLSEHSANAIAAFRTR